MDMLPFDNFEVVTFDCYGTLIDWEAGIVSALKPALAGAGLDLPDEKILSLYAEIESSIQAGGYQPYRDILQAVAKEFGNRLGLDRDAFDTSCLLDSLPNWPAFPDTVAALKALKQKFRLAIVSNVDDSLFVLTQSHLPVTFDWVITAQQAGAYKPSLKMFELAFERIGLPQHKILHAAQSIYHDIVPANSLGLSTVWVNRRLGKAGPGATPAAEAKPDLEVPDLATLASLAVGY
jgi:2-haloacid dehalogenase